MWISCFRCRLGRLYKNNIYHFWCSKLTSFCHNMCWLDLSRKINTWWGKKKKYKKCLYIRKKHNRISFQKENQSYVSIRSESATGNNFSCSFIQAWRHRPTYFVLLQISSILLTWKLFFVYCRITSFVTKCSLKYK